MGPALPVALDLDRNVEIDPAPEQHLDLQAGLRPRLLQQPAPLADDHALLGLPFDQDAAVDLEDAVVALDELVGRYRDRVRQLLGGPLQELLAHELGDEDRRGLIAAGPE